MHDIFRQLMITPEYTFIAFWLSFCLYAWYDIRKVYNRVRFSLSHGASEFLHVTCAAKAALIFLKITVTLMIVVKRYGGDGLIKTADAVYCSGVITLVKS